MISRRRASTLWSRAGGPLRGAKALLAPCATSLPRLPGRGQIGVSRSGSRSSASSKLSRMGDLYCRYEHDRARPNGPGRAQGTGVHPASRYLGPASTRATYSRRDGWYSWSVGPVCVPGRHGCGSGGNSVLDTPRRVNRPLREPQVSALARRFANDFLTMSLVIHEGASPRQGAWSNGGRSRLVSAETCDREVARQGDGHECSRWIPGLRL